MDLELGNEESSESFEECQICHQAVRSSLFRKHVIQYHCTGNGPHDTDLPPQIPPEEESECVKASHAKKWKPSKARKSFNNRRLKRNTENSLLTEDSHLTLSISQDNKDFASSSIDSQTTLPSDDNIICFNSTEAATCDEKNFSCQNCNEIFTSTLDFARHVVGLTCRALRPIACPLCLAGVMTSQAFDHFLSPIHAEEMKELVIFDEDTIVLALSGMESPYEHDGMSAEGLPETNFDRSATVDLKMKPGNYPCFKCSMTYSDHNHLRVHLILAHDMGRTYQRKDLPRRVILPASTMLRVSLGEKKVSCEICSAKFRSPDTLAIHHEQMHSQKKSYLLNKCLTLSNKGGDWNPPDIESLKREIQFLRSLPKKSRRPVEDFAGRSIKEELTSTETEEPTNPIPKLKIIAIPKSALEGNPGFMSKLCSPKYIPKQ